MISVVVLAAGESKRMGQPKMLLPWEDKTVLTHVISAYQKAGLEDIVVVTGGAKEQVEEAVRPFKVRLVHNQDYSTREMLSSIQRGIRALPDQTEAVLIALGDQPQVQERSVRMVCDAFQSSKANIIVPSYHMRRGHPWLVARILWDDLLRMEYPQSARDFMNAHVREIFYANTDDPNILADLDTPEDSQKWNSGNL